MAFRDFYAASTYTLPSHMSMFTGLDPVEHGLAHHAARINPEVRTLAERARQYERDLESYPPVHQETGKTLSETTGADIPPVHLSDRERKKLRALGYLD